MAAIHRIAYTVAERTNKGRSASKSWWVKIGASFLNKDGSETIYLDALPLNGKIVLQQPTEKPEAAK